MGGFVGDAAAARYPNHGRIAVTQFSVFAGVPLSLILMKVGIGRMNMHVQTLGLTHIRR